jgi:hypothetical protein
MSGYEMVLNLDALEQLSDAETAAWMAGQYCGEMWGLLSTNPERTIREPIEPKHLEEGPYAEILLRMAEATNRSFLVEPSQWFEGWSDVVFGPSTGLPDWIVGINERRERGGRR